MDLLFLFILTLHCGCFLFHRIIHVNNGPIYTRHRNFAPQSDLTDESYCSFHLVQISSSHSQSKLFQEIISNTTSDYLPHNTWRLYLCEDTLKLLHGMPGLLWIQKLQPHHKDGVKLNKGFSTQSDSKKIIKLTVLVAPDDNHIAKWKSSSKLNGIKNIQKINSKKYRLDVASGDLQKIVNCLINQPEVHWVNVVPEFVPQNRIATCFIQGNTMNQHLLWDKNITGMGQLVHVGDTGLDYDSCFFRDDNQPVVFHPNVNWNHRKIVSYLECIDEATGSKDHTDPPYAHGTHVSGSVAGKSIAENGDYNGMAPGAKLFFTDLASQSQTLYLPPDFDLYFRPVLEMGAFISSNSWGSNDITSNYIDTDRETDIFLYNNQAFLVVVASGNTGGHGILSPGSSKNSLSVGATYNSENEGQRESMASFSGYGPTWDGRIKPEVIAPGGSINSAHSDGILNSNQCGIEPKSGTSMATPLVSGAAALVRQYFYDGWYPTGSRQDAYGFIASAPLMKAVLIHAARNINSRSGAPDNTQGFGLVHIENVLRFNDSPFALYVENNKTVKHRQEWKKCLTVSGKLKVTMTWVDPIPAPEASRTIINNLDLSVNSDDQFYKPNKLGDRWEDNNIVEQIDVDVGPNPIAISISVYGNHIPISFPDGQPFAIVVTATTIEVNNNCPTKCPKCIHGKCVNGRCVCNSNYHHVDCSLCDEEILCNGHGQCNEQDLNLCRCDAHFEQHDCSKCSAGWYGPNCDSDCVCAKGTCDHNSGKCKCTNDNKNGFWAGRQCSRCDMDYSGPDCLTKSHWCRNHQTVQISDSEGIITPTGKSKYETNMQCTWILKAAPNTDIQLKFEWVDTEQDYDRVFIFDTETPNMGNPVARISGSEGTGQTFVTHTGIMHIYFDSDITNTARGFEARYRIISVPTFHTKTPTHVPTPIPTHIPTHIPTNVPTHIPTNKPTHIPTPVPTLVPTHIPTQKPTHIQTHNPTLVPTPIPTPKPKTPTPIPKVFTHTPSPEIKKITTHTPTYNILHTTTPITYHQSETTPTVAKPNPSETPKNPKDKNEDNTKPMKTLAVVIGIIASIACFVGIGSLVFLGIKSYIQRRREAVFQELEEDDVLPGDIFDDDWNDDEAALHVLNSAFESTHTDADELQKFNSTTESPIETPE